MKLIATKWISDYTPEGAIFEIPDDDRRSAETLIAAGLAKEHVEEPEPVSRRTYRRRDLRAEDEP